MCSIHTLLYESAEKLDLIAEADVDRNKKIYSTVEHMNSNPYETIWNLWTNECEKKEK